MAAGNRVGEIAWGIMPEGRLVSLDKGFTEALRETTDLLSKSNPLPLYEATFSHNGVLIRADLLASVSDGVRVVEVKSATQVKDYHLWDTASQLWVIEGAGYPVRKMEMAVIDTSFVYEGDGDYSRLLRLEDVTDQARLIASKVPGWVESFTSCLDGPEPLTDMGPHCSDPFECPFRNYCLPDDHPDYPLTCLPRSRQTLRDDLAAEGYEDIRDIPEGLLANETMERVRKVTSEGKPDLLLGVGDLLRNLPYPRFYLDFETIQFPVPIWKGTRPYEQLPFQWSCHIETTDKELEHRDFLDISGDSPLRGFAESLIAACEKDGPIIVYNQGFEKRIIREAADRFPDLADGLLALNERIFDLLPVAREYYYHPAMKGSWSLKALLPCVIPELNYGQLDGVHDGGEAQQAYLEAIAIDCTPDDAEKLREQLVAYCKLDTLAMVRIVEKWLELDAALSS